MKSTTLAATAVIAATTVMGAATPTGSGKKGVPSPSALPVLGAVRSQGCFKSSGELVKAPPVDFLSVGSCTSACKQLGNLVSGVHASDCWCGDTYPAKADRVDDSHCNYPCPYYDLEACGGISDGQFYGIFNNGIKVDVQPIDASPNPSGSGSGPSSTGSQSTATVTATSAPSSGGPSAGGIAAGVVCSVAAVGAIIGGVFFYLRRKRNKELEDEHHRNAAVSAFIGGGKPPSSSGGLSMTDSRMDPVMAATRRLSSGSIADNQDYSRKILRVTNA